MGAHSASRRRVPRTLVFAEAMPKQDNSAKASSDMDFPVSYEADTFVIFKVSVGSFVAVSFRPVPSSRR